MRYYTVYVGMEVNYVERTFIYKNHTVGDIVSAIGGLNAFINPIMGYFTIAFIVGFLY